MTLRHLRIFVAVCKYNSITQAANALHMAQPSISLAITELENNYQICLFDRISRKLYITQDGEKFLTYATHIISMFDELELGIKDWSEEEQLNIGASITISNTLLCDFIEEYKVRYPKRSLHVTIENSCNLEQKVLDHHLDFALIEGLPSHPQLKKDSFFTDELVLLCANEHPLTQITNLQRNDIISYPFLLREKGSGTREIFDSMMLVHDTSIMPIWESASTSALIKGVQRGFGLSVLPYQLVKHAIHNHEITHLHVVDISLQRDYYMIYHVNKYVNQAMLDFMRMCQEAHSEKE